MRLYSDNSGIKSRSEPDEALEIGRKPVDLPVAVARRFWSVAARDFLGDTGGVAIMFGAARGGFGECALGRGRQRRFLPRSIAFRIAFGRRWRCLVGWHRL